VVVAVDDCGKGCGFAVVVTVMPKTGEPGGLLGGLDVSVVEVGGATLGVFPQPVRVALDTMTTSGTPKRRRARGPG
jgi:hypothetical protein